MKTSELQGAALDWAVVKCECAIPAQFVSIPALLNGTVRVFRADTNAYSEPVSPSTDWAHGGPIIEREGIAVDVVLAGWTIDSWVAALVHEDKEFDGVARAEEYGPTPLIAAMRCYVASKFGDEVEIPKGFK